MRRPDPEAARLAQSAGAALARRDFAAARRDAQALLLRRPADPNAHQIMGLVALEQGDAIAARRHLEAADQAAPNQPNILNALGVALRRLGEVDPARAAFSRAGALGLIDGWRNLGALEQRAQRRDASIAAYQSALALAPNDAAAHAALAQAYEQANSASRARAHAERALALDPSNENARLAMAQLLLRDKDFVAAEAAAKPIVESPRAPATNQALAWGVIGEARDRRDDAPGAFAAFTAANHILLRQNQALVEASSDPFHPAGVARMTALAAAANISGWRTPSSFDTPAPVFLVGFPRSGTTLLDQVLSSHSRIICIEEREHLATALAHVLADAAKLARFADLGDDEIAAIRADYWRRVRDGAAAALRPVVIDKLPLNLVILPLIKRVFPDAPIILALRDPRDVVLSCYQQRFGMNPAMAQFLELERAGAYYDAVMRLMETCSDRLALRLHRVRYEDVVGDLESAARGLTTFLGEAFEPAMLDFHATALTRQINTPSARQVIEPLYRRSVGRWRRYARELAPVLPVLTPWAVKFGYSADG